MKFIKILMIILVVVPVVTAQQAADKTTKWRLVWDKNDPSDHVKDYTIYRDTHSSATTIIATLPHDSVGAGTTMEYLDSALTEGVQYFYRLKARNNAGYSQFSQEVSAAIPRITLNAIYNLGTNRSISLNLNNNVSYISGQENTLIWRIEPANNDTLTWSISDNTASINFPAVWYGTQSLKFTATSTDTFFSSAMVAFICDTSSGGGETQRIYDVQVDTAGVQAGQARITWKTDLQSRDRVRYGRTTAYGDSTELTSPGLTHQTTLTGLQSSVTYHFKIVSEFGGSETFKSGDYQFVSKHIPGGGTNPPDNTTPVNVYPIPLRLNDSNAVEQITFDDLPDNCDINIYSMLGDPVFQVTNVTGGSYIWNIRNQAGKGVRSGLYLYVVKSATGKQEGKLIIIR